LKFISIWWSIADCDL